MVGIVDCSSAFSAPSTFTTDLKKEEKAMKNLFALVVLVFLSTPFVACNRVPSPCLTCPTPPPVEPPQDGYEALGTRHALLTPSGEDAGMGATLVSVAPARGSVINNCGVIPCFTASLLLEEDSDNGRNRSARFEIYWSDDGVAPGILVRSMSVQPGTSLTTTLGPWILLDVPPRYILIVAQKGQGADTKSVTSFHLDFKL